MFRKIRNHTLGLLRLIQGRFKIDSLYVARGSFWITTSFAISSLLSLVQIIIFANFLPKEVFGYYKYVLSLSGALSFLTLTGMNTAVTQAAAKGRSVEILLYAIKKQLGWNLSFLVVLSCLAAYYFFQNNTLLASCLFILAITFPLAATFNTYGAFLSGKKNFKANSLYSMVIDAARTALLCIAALMTDSVFVLILVHAIMSFLPGIFLSIRTFKAYEVEIMDEDEKGSIFSYSKHLSIMHILSNIAQHLDKLIVFHYLGAAQLAIYGLAIAIPERLRGYQKSIGGILLPKLTSRNSAEIHKVFYTRILQGMAVGAIICFTYILLASPFYKLFLPKYLDSIRYSQVFSLTLIFILPASYFSGVFGAHKMLGSLYRSSLFASILRIALYLYLGSKFGIWGLIGTILLGYVLGTLYNIFLWEREFRKANQH